METEQLEEREETAPKDRSAYSGVLRYYELAKRAEWQVRDLPWGEVPPVPEYTGPPKKLARRQDLWRSVITQQLQADELAVVMAAQLFSLAPDPEAKLYYTTMVQDEARHTEAWLKLVEEAGGRGERDPYLDQLAHLTLEAETLEEKIFQIQVFCNRLTVDDGIHHRSGVEYERVLLSSAGPRTKQKLVDAGNRLLPVFVQHAMWRPKAREVVGRLMYETDVRMLRQDIEHGVRLAQSFGLDVSEVQIPV